MLGGLAYHQATVCYYRYCMTIIIRGGRLAVAAACRRRCVGRFVCAAGRAAARGPATDGLRRPLGIRHSRQQVDWRLT